LTARAALRVLGGLAAPLAFLRVVMRPARGLGGVVEAALDVLVVARLVEGRLVLVFWHRGEHSRGSRRSSVATWSDEFLVAASS
jgi:hypothetical protein